jgi:hypothetical protein
MVRTSHTLRILPRSWWVFASRRRAGQKAEYQQDTHYGQDHDDAVSGIFVEAHRASASKNISVQGKDNRNAVSLECAGLNRMTSMWGSVASMVASPIPYRD